MRNLASICLAFALAVTFGWSMPVRAHATVAQPSFVNHCADMNMPGSPTAQKAPVPAKRHSRDDCQMSCNLGCAVAAHDANPRVGEVIVWGAAFGPPSLSLLWRSVSPEAEVPPPRSQHI